MNSRIKEDVSRLFEYWCEIAPGSAAASPSAAATSTAGTPSSGDKSGGAAAAAGNGSGHIVQSFPESFKDAKVIADIPSFAFPCSFERRTIQVHSFVLTNIDSKWRFGFCRHDPKSPTAMVIVTYLPWHDTFIRFLNVLADVRKNSQQEFESFLAEAYNRGVPEPGGCLKLQYDRPVQTFSFQRPQQFLLPSIPENHNLNLYYNFVEPKAMIGVFAAMLAERRIIFVSRRLDILSSCIQAANAFLYPMVWQHIFIPVLPMKMRDILGAPMPFLIGVPEAVYESLRREEIGDVVILNCDKRTLDTPFDDVKNMPPELVASLKKHLANSAEHRGDRVSKIFLGILVQLIGGYRDAVKFNDKITFDPETFIDTRPSHLRPFLANMLHLQIFQQFIEERLDMLNTGQGFSDEFEVECFRYAEKSGRKVKQYKDLLKNFKDKTNPAVRSAVKSVKEGGKGVKTAYKGLRSKFRETTPPKSKLDSSGMHSHVSQYDMGHQSAPNSPVFNKRPQTIALPDDASYPGQHLHNHHAQMLTPSSTSLYNSPHYLVSNSASHNNYNTITAGCAPNALVNNGNGFNNGRNNNHQPHPFNTAMTTTTTTSASSASDVRSPSLSLSPTSSNSSSEMNLLQELQHLALFKSPAVNRNSSCVDVADANATTATTSSINTNNDRTTSPADASTDDLINLDTTNSSFELEDFDPLNENARPIPTTTSALTPAAGTPQQQLRSPRSPVPASAPPQSVGLGFNNPIYPYFTPTHLHATNKAHHQHSLSQGNFHHTNGAGGGGPRGSGLGSGSARGSAAQDDFELLRNYGLDKFSLLDGGGKEKQQQHHMASLLSSSNPASGSSNSSNFHKFGTVNSFVNGAGMGRPSSSSSTASAGRGAFNNWTTFD